MKKYLKCKVCGFIGTEFEMKKACPACGASVTTFEPYEYTISDKRVNLLNMHIHPILVHFPQSLASLMLIFSIVSCIQHSSNLLVTEKLLSIILPISVGLAAVAGMFDAMTRFRDRFGSIINQKRLFGFVFLISSTMTAFLINQDIFTILQNILIVILSFVSFACSAVLGKKGGTLLEAKINDPK
ncbi:DUF2231 domain-containing protein [uncultured Sphaerochaeta sp.]|uniref:DUF2231 domain-containing protein n=1 Tax=uncultured Sphaerochaeta sp. TaxID=886478 RepID=UPI002A0A1D6E|nr:DUF2231 domain-containing protein [uncultured Sphaerochaeta sp.]